MPCLMTFHVYLDSRRAKLMTLFVTCSTPLASMGLSIGEDFFWIDNYQVAQHSDFINLGLEQLLKAAGKQVIDIKELIVDHGPGSFTGVRVAVGFARALAYGLDISIQVCSSLKGLGEGTYQAAPKIKALNAFRQSAYCQRTSKEVELLSIIEFQQHILQSYTEPIELVGDLYGAYENFWSTEFKQKILIANELYQPGLNIQKFEANQPIPIHHPHVLNLYQAQQANLLRAESKSWNNCVPYYLRLSSAEEVMAEKNKQKS